MNNPRKESLPLRERASALKQYTHGQHISTVSTYHGSEREGLRSYRPNFVPGSECLRQAGLCTYLEVAAANRAFYSLRADPPILGAL
jgi:hypothetical protein